MSDPLDERPDVLVVMSDQQRPDSCGVYGQRLDVTPNLDALAAEGVAFDRAFTVAPVCGPARAAIQTARMPTEVGCWRNGLALPQGIPTLATRLGDLGYRCGYVGKWHLASDLGPGRGPDRPRADYTSRAVPPERRGGFDDGWIAADALEMTSRPFGGKVFDADGRAVHLGGYRVDALTDLAVEEIGRLRGGQPLLMFVSFLEPHHQNSQMRAVGPRGWARRFARYEVPGDLAWRPGDWLWNYPEYLACCASIDANLARLVEAMRSGARRDPVVVYTSDHGSHFRTRNLEYKRTCHDASIRVPLVVSGPGFGGGTRDDRLVSHLDLLPSLVAAAGGGDCGLDGRPLQHDDTIGPWRDAVLVQISESQVARCLRTATHTYSVRARGLAPLTGHRVPGADTYAEDKLYDNTADPHQRRNLVRDPSTRELRRDLAARLADEVERVEGRRPRIDMAR